MYKVNMKRVLYVHFVENERKDNKKKERMNFKELRENDKKIIEIKTKREIETEQYYFVEIKIWDWNAYEFSNLFEYFE